MRGAYTKFQTSSSAVTKDQWQAAKSEYDTWLEKGESFRRSHLDAKIFRYGNKAGKLLANLAKGQRPMTQIKLLKDKQGVAHNHPSKINEILSDFYKTLYARGDQTGGDPGKWLNSLALPTLTDEERGMLGGPITQEELECTITNLKAHKAPGPDGYTAEFFKILKAEISPALTQLFNSFMQGEPIPRFMNMAYIKVLPKPDKDLTLPTSYRPISLINVDLKLSNVQNYGG